MTNQITVHNHIDDIVEAGPFDNDPDCSNGLAVRCIISGCSMPQQTYKLCQTHYRYAELTGDPNNAPLEWLQKVANR